MPKALDVQVIEQWHSRCTMVCRMELSLKPGRQIGRYELLATIGRGGMANVMLARQRGPAGFEKLVVLKALRARFAGDPELVGMLFDEARLTARIDHPNVVQAYELGEDRGVHYIAMEYLAGESLFDIIRRCRRSAVRLPPPLAARIVSQAAEGLHAAHEIEDARGHKLELIHRDVSPENIVVLYNGQVKIVDFGIAKSHARITKTRIGVIKGKYAYMSPEHIQDRAIDRRSDVFALGVVLWEALTLRRMVTAPDLMTTLKQLLHTPRIRPSQIRPGVPRGLDEVVLTALQPDPECRFQSAAALARAIEDETWSYRCGANELRAFMAGTFRDRFAERRKLVARAKARSSEPLLSFVPERASTEAITIASTTSPARTSKRSVALGLGVVIFLAVLVASFIALTGTSIAIAAR